MDARPIVIAYDGSDRARAAIAYAGEVLRYSRAVVMHVWAPVERAKTIAEEGAELARGAGFDAEALFVQHHGAPWRSIVEYATDAYEGIVRHAHRPVLVVPDT